MSTISKTLPNANQSNKTQDNDLPVVGGVAGITTVSGSGNILVSAGPNPIVSLQGIIPIVSGGTGLSTVGTNGQVLTASGGALVYSNVGTGTVTSVAATVPSVLSISGSPVTTTGTLAIGYSGTALPILNGGTSFTTAGSGIGVDDEFLTVIPNQLIFGDPNELVYRNLKQVYPIQTFTPTVASNATINSVNYTLQQGRWRQTGTTVTCFFHMTGDVTLATGGNFIISSGTLTGFPTVFNVTETVVISPGSSIGSVPVAHLMSAVNIVNPPNNIFAILSISNATPSWIPYPVVGLTTYQFDIQGSITFIIA